MTWLVPREELTVAQERAAALNPTEHRLILGSPGSGKTIVLLHRARHLVDTYSTPPERYRIFVFTRVLKAYIRTALEDLDLPDECVMTFDAWCTEFYRAHVNPRIPWNTENKTFDFAAVHQGVWEKTRSTSSTDKPFDFVLVDEGQDLDTRAFEIIQAVSHHVTVFMDHKQQLYDSGADEQGILHALGLRRRNLSLLDAYRCSPYIVQVASSFIRDSTERDAFIEQHPPLKTARQMPLLYLAANADDERAHLVDMVRNRIDKNDRMAILFPTKRHVYGYARALLEAGLEVEVPSQAKRKKGGKKSSKSDSTTLPEIDFSTPLPKLMPYPSAKGLTFDTVLMPRLIPGLFGKVDLARLERWLFVGITRATQWVYFSTINDSKFLFLDRFKSLEERKQLCIRFSDDLLSGGAPTAQPLGDDDNEGGELSDLF